jgi:transposase
VVPGSDGGPGQPPYHPGDLLKLYLYGYLQRVRSSRALEREAARNPEVWLIRGLRPRYRTIADFRKDNWAALKAVNREFVVLARKLDLIGGDVVAIDGAFFDGNAGKRSIKTRRKIEAHLAAIDAYGASLEANYNGHALKACEEDGIVAYVPQAKRTARLAAQDRISHEEFVYDADQDAYHCPAGKLLTPSDGRKTNTGGRIEIKYTSRKADCDACPLRTRCLSAKTPTRTVYRWEHEDVLERHREQMKGAQDRMRRCAELAEHPFGTLKCRAGYRHFLVRGFNKIRGKWSLMALCYNFSRVLKIVGIHAFMAYLATFWRLLLRSLGTLLAIARPTSLVAHLGAAISTEKGFGCLRLRFVRRRLGAAHGQVASGDDGAGSKASRRVRCISAPPAGSAARRSACRKQNWRSSSLNFSATGRVKPTARIRCHRSLCFMEIGRLR